ncbi:MAG: tetraacyldisaccharide 4'-kinase [Mariniblastus sp.]|nr:tetraacyldisaccharide 4'-kinase [Mariniblastus sp.]
MAKAKDYSGMLRILSGEQRGPLAMLFRAGLWLLTPVYRLGVGWRNWKFNRGKGVHRVDVPVISVGNLTTGGTGKTPFVIWLASHIRAIQVDSPHGRRLAIISRGYGSLDGQVNDEALEMEQRLPAVPHLQGPDRVQLANTAIEELETEIILLDDGFQHRRIDRDLDIVLVDATRPFGYGHLLPRGLLREPVASLDRADVVVLTRCNQVHEECRKRIKERVLQWNPTVLWAECDMQPTRFLQASGTELELEELRGQSIVAISAIGNPGGFQSTLTQLGLEISDSIVWGDHHHYSREDLETIRSLASRHPAKAVVCTHKDLVKLNVDRIGSLPLYALQVDIVLGAGQASLEQRLQELVTGSTLPATTSPEAGSAP